MVSQAEEVYAQHIRLLPARERARLLVLLASDLSHSIENPNGETPESQSPVMMSITERLARAGYAGGRLFKTADEVDSYIREERDSWER